MQDRWTLTDPGYGAFIGQDHRSDLLHQRSPAGDPDARMDLDKIAGFTGLDPDGSWVFDWNYSGQDYRICRIEEVDRATLVSNKWSNKT